MKKLKVLLLTAGLIGALSIAGGCGSKTPSGDDVDNLGMSKEEMNEMREEMADENDDDVKSEEDSPKTKTETITLTLSDGHTISFESPEATSVTQDGKTATVIYENGEKYYKVEYKESNIKSTEKNIMGEDDVIDQYFSERGVETTSSRRYLSYIFSPDSPQGYHIGENFTKDEETGDTHFYILNDVGSENYLEIVITNGNRAIYDMDKAASLFVLNRHGELNPQ